MADVTEYSGTGDQYADAVTGRAVPGYLQARALWQTNRPHVTVLDAHGVPVVVEPAVPVETTGG